jgi:hypothetical protein
VTAGGPPPGRLTPRQAVGWSVAFAVILALVVLFFIYGRQVRPALGF